MGAQMPLIYTPSGKAREYSPLALNIYNGCDHGCTYCYTCLIKRSADTNKVVQIRNEFIKKLESELCKSEHKEQIWTKFLYDAVNLLRENNKKFYIKHDLQQFDINHILTPIEKNMDFLNITI